MVKIILQKTRQYWLLIHSMILLSEGGKLWSLTKETVKGVNLIENLKNIYPQQDLLE
jgi:hypothetical protein